MRFIDEVRPAAALDCVQWQRNSKECVVHQSWVINESFSGPLIPLSHHNSTFFSTHLHPLNVLMSDAAAASLLNSPIKAQIRGWILHSDALRDTINKPEGEASRLKVGHPLCMIAADVAASRAAFSRTKNKALYKWTDSVWGKHTAISWPIPSATVCLCWRPGGVRMSTIISRWK